MSKLKELYEEITVVIPAKNEGESLDALLDKLNSFENKFFEIIVVNDGSTDNTSDICTKHHVTEVKHAVSLGNGAAIKSGARKVTTKYMLCMDADGQHPPESIPPLVEEIKGNDLVIAARYGNSQANLWRRFANKCYNIFATYMTGHKVLDLTSGFRIFNTSLFCEYIYLYPNGFSYPTTSTMAFFRSGHRVTYVRYKAQNREGTNSHISILKDGLRFLLIIFKIGTLYSPLKIFAPIALLQFSLGLSNYAYTYFSYGKFTNMSALLMTSALFIFLIGLVSEQITTLMYKH